MVVYADVLIVLNTLITYFVLLASRVFSRASAKTYRLVLASIFGGISSLYIFLPTQHYLLEFLAKLIFSVVITAVAFGFFGIKKFLQCFFAVFAVSFIFAGFMMGFWSVIRPNGMVINNGVVYFSISPIVLIVSTVVCYFLVMLIKHVMRRKDTEARHKMITVQYAGDLFAFDCIVDTGNTISDPFENSKVIILCKGAATELFGKTIVDNMLRLEINCGHYKKLRLLPYKTISGNGLMPALHVDKVITADGTLTDVLVGVLREDFSDFEGIISPSFFD